MLTLVLVTGCREVSSVTVTGQIMDDRSFYYRRLPAPPSKSATIEYTIMFPGDYVDLHIYTTEIHINLKKKCSYLVYGQFLNTIMNQEFSLERRECFKSDGQMMCKRGDNFQDYIPRNFGFSFGFKCQDASRKSLRGLSYSVTIKDQSNDTKCTQMANIPINCTQYYTLATFPNLMDDQYISHVPYDLKHTLDILNAFFDTHNYQHFLEVWCYLIFPQCDPVNNIMIPPCKESVKDLREGSPRFIRYMATFLQLQVSYTYRPDYLPSKDGSIPCFYKPVTCPAPPKVNNAKIVSGISPNGTYHGQSKIEYRCKKFTDKIQANSKIICLSSGKWSHRPKCKVNLVKFLIPPLFVIVLLGVGIAVIICYRNKKKNLDTSLTRTRSYDAYVCFNFDTDSEYVMGTILPELKENCEPPFKLLMHTRDFEPGFQIVENIENAIQDSNSAIIVMSQGFVDSVWCKEEFTLCYVENMNDPAFKLFAIMMQPVNELENLSGYMKSFFSQQTYLKREDPDLF